MGADNTLSIAIVIAFGALAVVGIVWARGAAAALLKPGDVVWTFIRFEDEPGEGKDRPVIIIDVDGRRLSVVGMTSNSKRDGQRGYVHIGNGSWDHLHRDSWANVHRVVVIPRRSIRRRGGSLDPSAFKKVLAATLDSAA